MSRRSKRIREAKRQVQAQSATAQPAALAPLRAELDARRRHLKESIDLLPALWWDRAGGYARDPRDFDRGGYPYGSTAGYGADRRTDRSHAPLPYMTEVDYFAHVSLARDLLTRNHYGIGFLRHLRAFVGKVSVAFVLKGSSPGPSAAGPVDADGDGRPDVDPLVQEVTEAWEEFCEANEWGQGAEDRHLEALDRWLGEGECTLRFFRGDRNNPPAVRFIDPEFIRTPHGSSLADPEGWGVETAPGDAETVRRLWLSFDPADRDPEPVDASRVARIKNTFPGMARSIKRGFSEAAPTQEHLWKIHDLFSNMEHVAQLQAKIAWVEQFGPGVSPDQARNLMEAGRTYELNLPTFGGTQTANVQQYLPGSRLAVENGRQFTPGPTANPGGFIEIYREVMKGVAFSNGLPASFTGEGGDSFAGVLVTGSPFVTLTEERQERVKGLVLLVVRRFLALCEESGRLPEGTGRKVKPVLTSRPIVMADDQKQAATDLSLLDKGVADPYELIEKRGGKPKVVLANLADWRRKLAEMGGAPGGGGGLPPPGLPPGGGGPNPAPPGSAGGDGSSPNADPLAGLFGESIAEGEGLPPFPGAVFDRGKHRWVQPNKGRDSAGNEHAAAQLPSGDELAKAPGHDLKAGGQVRAVALGGKGYVVKQAANTAESGPAEVLAADLARAAGVRVPAAAMTTAGGQPALVQEFARGKTLKALKAESPEAARAALAKVPKQELDRHVLVDYLLGNTDVHDGNYLVAEGGTMTAIDKEMVLGRGNLTSQRFEPPHLLSLTRPDGAGMLHEFGADTVKAMAAAGGKMADTLDAKGMKREARQVRDRAAVLAKLAEDPKPTAGALYALGSKGVTPPGLGVFGKLKWHLTKG